MANSSLSKSTSKLNLTREQSYLFRDIISAGNQMADMLAELEHRAVKPKIITRLVKRWSKLMVRLAIMFLP